MFDRKFAQILALCALAALGACGEAPAAKTNCWTAAPMSFVASKDVTQGCWAEGVRR